MSCRCSGSLGKTVGRFYHHTDSEPSFSWLLNGDAPCWSGLKLQSRGVFQRYDVFTENQRMNAGLDRAMAWFTPISAWALLQDDIRMFNRHISGHTGLKPYTLIKAQEFGLSIPQTLLSNELDRIKALGSNYIAKPVMGGAYTKNIGTAIKDADIEDGCSPMAALVQEKLVYPEYRVFAVGKTFHSFRLHSKYIDYRPAQDNKIEYIGSTLPSQDVARSLQNLLDYFQCDFCACDFKTHPDSQEMIFLELNNGPMFAVFDACAQGKLTQAMVHWLCD